MPVSFNLNCVYPSPINTKENTWSEKIFYICKKKYKSNLFDINTIRGHYLILITRMEVRDD